MWHHCIDRWNFAICSSKISCDLGSLGVIFSLFSILSLGRLFVGMILGIIGGAMGIAWKPAPPQIPTPPVPSTPAPQPPSVISEREVITREVVMIPCAYCGNLMPQASTFCPNCGAKRKYNIIFSRAVRDLFFLLSLAWRNLTHADHRTIVFVSLMLIARRLSTRQVFDKLL